MIEQKREQFMNVAREGLELYGVCTGRYEDDEGKCCAAGAYAKVKFDDAFAIDDLSYSYRCGVTTGFDNKSYLYSSTIDKKEYEMGIEDGRILRNEFIK